jgi:hypothetical protein
MQLRALREGAPKKSRLYQTEPLAAGVLPLTGIVSLQV